MSPIWLYASYVGAPYVCTIEQGEQGWVAHLALGTVTYHVDNAFFWIFLVFIGDCLDNSVNFYMFSVFFL